MRTLRRLVVACVALSLAHCGGSGGGGPKGRALRFDLGRYAFVNAAAFKAAIGAGGFTVEAWLKPDSVTDTYLQGIAVGQDLSTGSRSWGLFLEDMVEFANESCWGTLSCVVLVHPATQKAYSAELENALANLRYGGIAVNCFAGVIYALVGPTWGAFPGHPDEDIRSGRGVVHNALLFDHPEKSVVRAPFHIDPTPAWFADHKTLHDLGRELVKLEAKPSLLRLPLVLPIAMRG